MGGRLHGQVTIVTGAGRGLGYAIARRFAGEGAAVVAVARGAPELDDLAAATRSDRATGSIDTLVADLADPVAVERVARHALERYGRVDTLVNNAAILRITPFLAMPAEAFDETIAVNLLAPVRLTRAVLPAMLAQRRGAIVNVSSAAGVRPFADETDYCAAKYGLEGFSLSLALELAPHNISVNLVTPGGRNHPGFRIKPTSVTAAEFAAWPPERRAPFGDPSTMGDAFVFLALQGGRVSGRRFHALDLAERIGAEGWELAFPVP